VVVVERTSKKAQETLVARWNGAKITVAADDDEHGAIYADNSGIHFSSRDSLHGSTGPQILSTAVFGSYGMSRRYESHSNHQDGVGHSNIAGRVGDAAGKRLDDD
jgi:hypothetical protein